MDHGSQDPDAVTLMQMQHALFIVGTQHLFLVHMTNFAMDCHRYQVILRVEIPDDVKTTFLEDRERHPDCWYIIGNTAADKMNLTEIKRGARTSFTGSIWRCMPKEITNEDWPWDGAPTVAESFEVRISQVVYFRRFDYNLNRPNTLTYVLFGAGHEAHLNHYQVKPPEFDHVVTLSEAPAWLPTGALEAGLTVNFPDIPADPNDPEGTGVYCSDPLEPGTHYVQYGGYGPGRAITIDRTIWFGTWPVNKTDPCPGREKPPCDKLPGE